MRNRNVGIQPQKLIRPLQAIVPALLGECQKCEIGIGIEVFRVGFDSLLKRGPGAFPVALHHANAAQHIPGRGVLGVQTHRRLQFLLGLLQVRLPLLHFPECLVVGFSGLIGG